MTLRWLAALVLLLAACGSESSVGRSTARVPAGLETGCPAPSTELRLPGGDLPGGATRVRLCPGPPLTGDNGDPLGEGEIQGPADLLTSGVAELVGLVNAQDDIEGGLECTSDAGPELVYWFGYPGGDWRAVQFGSYGCNVLTVGEDLRREGGEALAIAFTEALMTQREGSDRPQLTQQASCPVSPLSSPHSGLVLDEAHLASAAWCVSPRPQQVREVAIPPDLVQRLNASLWPGSSSKSRRPCREAVPTWIEGITPWGDSVGFGIGPCGDIYPAHGATLLDDDGQHYLTPELDAALTALPLGPVIDTR